MTTFDTTNNAHYYAVIGAVDAYITRCYNLANQAELDLGMEGFSGEREYAEMTCEVLFEALMESSEEVRKGAYKFLSGKGSRNAIFRLAKLDELDAISAKTYCELALIEARTNGDMWSSELHPFLVDEYARMITGRSVFTLLPD
jgi:hypothetical protein